MKTTFALVCCSLFTLCCLAEDQQPSLLARPGAVLFEDDFSRAQLAAPKWRVGKGFWSIEDGVVRAAENPDDHHGAYAKANFPCKDIVVDFSFKFDGSKSFNFGISDNAYKGSHAGHVCTVVFAPDKVQLTDQKLGNMKNEYHDKMIDEKTTAAEKKELQASIKDKSAAFKTTIDPAAWHKAHVELVGDEMLAFVDGKPVGYLKSGGIAHETKNLLGWTVSGKSTLFDNYKVCEATANPEWPAKRDEVVASLHK
jgi:hypothetical protein